MSRPRVRALALTLFGLVLAAGCAAPPEPAILVAARERLAGPEVETLFDLHPRLLREAREASARAERALVERDLEAARLHAHLAVQRFDSARNLLGRDAAEQLLENMSEASLAQASRGEALAAERRELERYRALEARFDAVSAELGEVRASDRDRAQEARRRLFSARARQAEALAAGASTRDLGAYASARLDLDTALESFDAGLYDEAGRSAAAAGAAFEAMAERARRDAAAPAPTRTSTGGASPRDAEGLRRALAEASDARSAAVSAGAEEASGPAFAIADATLEAAASGPGEPAEARARALAARDLFFRLARAASQRPAREKAPSAPGARPVDETAALAAPDLARRADEPAPRAAPSIEPVYGAGERFRDKAEELLVDVQLERAAALGRGLDTACPASYREFESVFEVAEQRFRVGDFPRALEIAARASERLARCERSEPSRPRPGPSPEAKAAAKKVAEAQAALAVLSIERGEDPRLEQPASFVANAEAWLERGGLIPAAALAERGLELLRALAAEPEAARAQPPPSEPSATEAASTRASTPPPETIACPDVEPLDARVRQLQLELSALPLGQTSTATYRRAVGARARGLALKDAGDCAAAALLLEGSVELLEGLAASATLPAQPPPPEAAASASPLAGRQSAAELTPSPRASGAPSRSERGARVPASSPRELSKSDREVDAARAESALGRARLARAAAVDSSEEPVFSEAERLLERARGLAEGGRYGTAAALADEATTGFRALARPAREAPPPTASAAPPAKGASDEAYAKIIEARIARDRAVARAGRPEATRLEEGRDLLRRARETWRAADFVASARLAEAARTDFDAVVTASEARAAAAKAERAAAAEAERAAAAKAERAAAAEAERAAARAAGVEDEAARRGADEEARRAAEAEQKAAARARRDAETRAARAEATKAAARAREAAVSARLRADEKLEAEQKAEARAKAKAEVDARAEAQAKARAEAEEADGRAHITARRAAEDALREASVKAQLCARRGCMARDEATTVAAGERLRFARRALGAEDFARAQELAEQAETEFAAVLDAAPAFVLPEGEARVVLAGDRLRLSPSVTFELGDPKVGKLALPALDALAKALLANQDALKRLRVVGHTDARGDASRNLDLSRRRAARVRDALLARGVPAALVVAEGRGERDPVASNDTPEGREMNRRVEFVLELEGASTADPP